MAYLIRWLMLKWIIVTSCLYWEKDIKLGYFHFSCSHFSSPYVPFLYKILIFCKMSEFHATVLVWKHGCPEQHRSTPDVLCCECGERELDGDAESSDNLSWTESLDEESLQRFLYGRGANQKKTSLWEMSLPLGIFSRREVAGNNLKILMLSLCNCDDISPSELI